MKRASQEKRRSVSSPQLLSTAPRPEEEVKEEACPPHHLFLHQRKRWTKRGSSGTPTLITECAVLSELHDRKGLLANGGRCV